jgi:Domain of unknown function DUF29
MITMPEQTILAPPSQKLYEQDFWLWTQTMAQALKSGNFSQLDLENLAEEVESLGRSDRRELQSRLTVLLMHLLKWQFQPEMQSGSWRGTLAEQRIRITKLLKESPSLRSFFELSIDECYDDAKVKASEETGLMMVTFPVICPYEIENILSIEFLPD